MNGVSYVERLERSRRLAFTPNDPLLKKQWYLGAIHAFDAWPVWPVKPALGSVKVAIIDSGIDGNHPEFDSRIDDAQSFVPDSPNPRKDPIGHGTFVAGLIAAELNNGTGIAGIGFPSRLLIAKVVRADGTISPEAEARAIRWAVERGARVINLSLAAYRNPLDPANDQYSALEEDAVEWAVRQGVVVVAAVGNGEGAPKLPWRYASYPAALPHVIGVGAAAVDGSVPDFSNGDPTFDDVTAPGAGILSTVPRDLSTDRPTCQGYSVCGPDDFRRGDGTSYAAAQVSAAAALLIAQNPGLMPDQVAALIERNADDMSADSGCKRCTTGRDDASGWGMLDIAGALQRATSDLPCPRCVRAERRCGDARVHRLGSKRQVVSATLDFWDDPTDVYRVFLKAGTTLSAAARRQVDRADDEPLAARDAHDRRDGGRVSQAAPSRGRERGRRHAAVLVQGPVQGLVLRPGERRRGAVRDVRPDAGEAAPQLAGQELLLGHLAQDARRVADDQDARRYVAHDHGARAHERLLADLHAGAEDRAAAHAGAAADRRPAQELLPLLGPAHEVVVRRHDARRDEDVLLERRVRRHVGVRLDLRHAADRGVVLDQRAAADDDVVADGDPLADAGLVADDHALAEARSREHDRAGGDDRARRRSRAAAAARASPSSAATATAACPRRRRPRGGSPPRSPCRGR